MLDIGMLRKAFPSADEKSDILQEGGHKRLDRQPNYGTTCFQQKCHTECQKINSVHKLIRDQEKVSQNANFVSIKHVICISIKISEVIYHLLLESAKTFLLLPLLCFDKGGLIMEDLALFFEISFKPNPKTTRSDFNRFNL